MITEIPPISADLIARYGGPAPRYTSYPTVPHWHDARGSEARRNAIRAAPADAALDLYVHIPFCEAMCDFCGCNVIVRKDRSVADGYLSLVGHELANLPAVLGRRPIHGLHLGGGTPTFLRVDQLERLMNMLRAYFEFDDEADLAIEVNPTVTTVEQVKALGRMGFSRISLGVQDTDPTVLAGVGREQTVEQTLRIIDAARGAGFVSVNVDLIYGLPHQTVRSWANTLDRIGELRPDRIAAFGFAYVPQLKPNQLKLAADAMPDPVTKLDLYRQAFQMLTHSGYQPIGLDHFALAEDPLAFAARQGTLGRNFQGYVVDDSIDLLGLGVSAISQIGNTYAQNASRTRAYRESLAICRPTLQRACRPTPEEVLRRRSIVDLMCHRDTDLAPLGPDAEDCAALEELAGHGLIQFDGRHVAMTPISRVFLRRIAAALDPATRPAAQPVHSQL